MSSPYIPHIPHNRLSSISIRISVIASIFNIIFQGPLINGVKLLSNSKQQPYLYGYDHPEYSVSPFLLSQWSDYQMPLDNSKYISAKRDSVDISNPSQREIRSPLGTMRFGKRGNTPLGTMRFGKRDNTPFSTMRFGKRDTTPFGTMRFGKRDSTPFGTMRFGKRDTTPFGTMRFGKRDSTPFGTMRFGKRKEIEESLNPFQSEEIRLDEFQIGKKNNQPPLGTMRFGKRDDNSIDQTWIVQQRSMGWNENPLGTMRFG